MDCVSATASGGPLVNCNLPATPKMKIDPPTTNLVPITVEFSEKTGSASLKVEWKLDNQAWAIVPLANLEPNLGLTTSQITGPDWTQAGKTDLQTKTIWTYPSDLDKARHLPDSKIVRDITTGIEHKSDFVYDDYGRKTKITRYANAATQAGKAITDKTYTGACLTKVVGPTGAVTDYVCNASGDVTQTTQEISQVMAGSTLLQASENRTATTTYDAMGRATQIEHPGPGVEQMSYDLSGRQISNKVLLAGALGANPVWATSSTSFNDYPAAGVTPTFTETQPDPDGAGTGDPAPYVVHTLDWVGNELSHTDPRTLLVWSSTYDGQNRVLTSATPDPAGSNPALVTTNDYKFGPTPDEASVTRVTGPDGVTSRTAADILGRTTNTQTGYVDAGGFHSSAYPANTCYDEVGNVIRSEVRALGATCSGTSAGNTGAVSWSETDYDAFGHQLKTRAPWVDQGQATIGETIYNYSDVTGELLSVNGPLVDDAMHKDRISFAYDLAGRTTTVSTWVNTLDAPYVTNITYNDAGDRLRISSDLSLGGASRQKRDFSYDKAGRQIAQTDYHGNPTGGYQDGIITTAMTYDVGGRLVQVADPRGITQSFVYDNLGRETSRCQGTACSGIGTSTDEIYTRYNADGSISDITRATRGYTYTYDELSRMTKIRPVNSGVIDALGRTEYTFNALGQVASTRTPATGSTPMTYAYFGTGEAGGQPGALKSLTDPFTNAATTWTYDGAGRATGKTDAAGMTWTRSFELQSGALDTQQVLKAGRTYASFDLGYDGAGDVISRAEKLWRAGNPGSQAPDTGTGDWSYAYDGQGRMLSATGPTETGTTKTWAYTYDGMGNRLSIKEGSAPAVSTSTDLQGWPVSSSDGTNYVFDASGDMTAIDAPGTALDQSFTYDTWGLTTAATQGATQIGYTLDPLGRTISRTQGAVTSYAYEASSEDISTETTSGTTTSYVSGPGGPLAMQVSGTTSFFIQDLHSDTVGLIGASSTTMSQEYYYSPFGERKPLIAGSSTLGFQSDITDPVTGTVDMGTRLYMPSLGRFTSRDVLFGDPADPMSMNQFAYAQGNPVSASDPTGMQCVDGPCHATPTFGTFYPRSHCDYCDGTQTASVYRFPIEVVMAAGVVRGGLYIGMHIVPDKFPGPNQPDLLGDDRYPDDGASREDYRVFMKFDFTKGVATVRVNPSCVSPAAAGACRSALDFGDSGIPWGKVNKITPYSAGDDGAGIAWDVRNSYTGSLFAGKTNVKGSLYVNANPPGSVDVLWQKIGWPSFELFQHSGSSLHKSGHPLLAYDREVSIYSPAAYNSLGGPMRFGCYGNVTMCSAWNIFHAF